MPKLKSRLYPLADCGLPAFTFAGFQWPRYVVTMPYGHGKPAALRLKNRRQSCTGDYYHSPTPGATERGFYLGEFGRDRAAGLRFEYADEVSGSGIRHRGWYADDDCYQTIRGIVCRLPKGRGFVMGWTMGEGMASAIDYRQIFDDAADCASAADSWAESVAESERDYQRAEIERMNAEDVEAAEVSDD